MASSQANTTTYSRRMKWLAAGIVVLAAAYSGAWYWIAGEIDAEVRQAIAGEEAQGRTVNCENSTVRGYPFRLGLFCDSVGLRLPAEGINLSAGALRSAAQVYAPGHVVTELDGPAFIDIPDLRPLRLDWELLHASLIHSAGEPERVSVEAKAMAVGQREAGDNTVPVLKFDQGETHVRIVGEALDIASSGEGLVIAVSTLAGIPKAAFRVEASLPGGAPLIRGQMADKSHPLRGQTFDLRDVTLSFPEREASISLKGTAAIDARGLADGTIELRFTKPEVLGEAVRIAFPQAAPQIDPVIGGLTAIAQTGAPVTITLTKGKISAGLFPLGELPPL
jgi:hypothetical protein